VKLPRIASAALAAAALVVPVVGTAAATSTSTMADDVITIPGVYLSGASVAGQCPYYTGGGVGFDAAGRPYAHTGAAGTYRC
jgi:hypothetical protein